jgi:hypothetical protein
MRQCLLIVQTFSVSMRVRLLCDGTCAVWLLCDGTCAVWLLCDGTCAVWLLCDGTCAVWLLCDGTCAETRFHLSAKRTRWRTSAGVNGRSAVGRQGVHVSNSVCASAGMAFFLYSCGGFRPLHSPVLMPCTLNKFSAIKPPLPIVWVHVPFGAFRLFWAA